MNRRTFLALLALSAACGRGEQPQAREPAADTMLVAADSLRTPESVLYDATLDAYLVSNINGSPTEKDDNGFIARIGIDGRVIEPRWVDGASDSVTLHAPKGMAIKGDTLFVADIDVVRLFDRTTGSPLGERAVPRATFLNDVAVAPDGTVYVSDTGLRPDFSRSNSDAIHRFLPNGKAVPVARGAALGQPNGITADSAGLVVVTWSGAVYRITGSGRRLELPSPGRAQLDGVERLADGTLIVSTWQDSSIIRLAPGDTAWTRLVGGVVSPADIGWDTRRSRLLIPVFQGDRVEIRPQP